VIRRLAWALALGWATAWPALAQQDVPEPPGYRTDNYRAPVPTTLQGAQVLTTAQAEALWRTGEASFIDVLPRPPKPNLPAGTVWREAPRPNIPGSLWLPDTGYGELAWSTEDYFKRGLQRWRAGWCSTARPIAGCPGMPRSAR
jgi:PQQ-dependent catabolism-associated CXXCW motif protein